MKDYPSKYSREEIQEIINKALENIPKSDQGVRSSQVGAKWITEISKVQLGINELQNRENTKIAKWTRRISILSLLIAATALGVSYFSLRSSQNWQESQIELLDRIEENTEIENNYMSKDDSS